MLTWRLPQGLERGNDNIHCFRISISSVSQCNFLFIFSQPPGIAVDPTPPYPGIPQAYPPQGYPPQGYPPSAAGYPYPPGGHVCTLSHSQTSCHLSELNIYLKENGSH